MLRRTAPFMLALGAAVVLSGCAAPQPLPTPTPTPTETIEPTGDGVLHIGTLFALDGDLGADGPGQVAAAELAVRDINVAGGALGQPVELLHRNAGGDGDQRLEAAFADLVARGVDVVIGPPTEGLAERLIPLAAEAGVTVISPIATAPAVREAQPGGAFFRTLPADDRQAVAVVDAAAQDRAETVALLTTDDAVGPAVELAVQAAVDERGMELVAVEQVDATTNLRRLASALADERPDAVILATGALTVEQNAALLQALVDRRIDPAALWLTGRALADYAALLPAGALDGANAVQSGAEVDEVLLARLRQSDPGVRTARFAPEVYDAVVLAALATQLAGDDGGPSIAWGVAVAAGPGISCRSYGECLEVLETEPAIDYDGLSGTLTLDGAGDVIDGVLSAFSYSAANTPGRVGVLTIPAR